MGLASELHDLALKYQDKNAISKNQLNMYNEFIAKDKHLAALGNLEYEHQFPVYNYDNEYQKWFHNFQTDFVVVKQLLQNDGFTIDTNIYTVDIYDICFIPYLKISW